MEFIGHILLAIFVALIVLAALTFGFVLLIWFVAFAVAVSAIVMLRAWWRRWWFLYSSRDRRTPHRKSPTVTDADWRDISDEE